MFLFCLFDLPPKGFVFDLPQGFAVAYPKGSSSTYHVGSSSSIDMVAIDVDAGMFDSIA